MKLAWAGKYVIHLTSDGNMLVGLVFWLVFVVGQFITKSTYADPEAFGGFGFVAIGIFQSLDNKFFFHGVYRASKLGEGVGGFFALDFFLVEK